MWQVGSCRQSMVPRRQRNRLKVAVGPGSSDSEAGYVFFYFYFPETKSCGELRVGWRGLRALG